MFEMLGTLLQTNRAAAQIALDAIRSSFEALVHCEQHHDSCTLSVPMSILDSRSQRAYAKTVNKVSIETLRRSVHA